MSKISNKQAYPNQSPIEGADYLIGTAANSNPIEKQTKTFLMSGIANFVIDQAFDGVSFRLPVFTASIAGVKSKKLVSSIISQDVAQLSGDVLQGTTITIDDGNGIGNLVVAQDVAVGDDLTVADTLTVEGLSTFNGDAIFNAVTTLATTSELHLLGPIYDANDDLGNNEQVLVSDGLGNVTWQNFQGSGLEFQSAWNADTNSPDLQNYPLIPGNTGKYWVVSVAGSTPLTTSGGGTITDWQPGDWALISEDDAGNVFWDKIDNSSVDGAGTQNNIAMWTSAKTLGDAAPVTMVQDPVNSTLTIGIGDQHEVDMEATLVLQGKVKDNGSNLGVEDDILVSDANSQLSYVNLADISVGGAEVVEANVKNVSGGPLVKGDPVYISGSVGASGRLEVQLADASDPNKMPALGLLKQDLANNEEGKAIITGKLRNLVTSPIDGVTPSENDVIYVKPSGSSGSALTTTKPINPHLIQNMGKVGRVSTSNDGNFVVSSILRTNDVPNLDQHKIFVGTSTNTAQSTTATVNDLLNSASFGNSSAAATGNYSFASGSSTASNTGSVALGTASSASGLYSVALGEVADAQGRGSFAVGTNSEASADFAFAIGDLTQASAQGSFAIGQSAVSSHSSSVAIGTSATTTAANQTAIGKSIRFVEYGQNPSAHTGTPVKNLSVDSGGIVIETALASTGTGTTNTLPLWTDGPNGVLGDSIVSQDVSASDLFIDGNVGIGVNAPYSELHVRSDDNPVATVESYQSTGGNFQAAIVSLRTEETSTNTTNRASITMHGPNSVNTGGAGNVVIQNFTTSGGQVVIAPRSGGGTTYWNRFKTNGQVQFEEYGSGTLTGTPTKNLSVDSNGNIIETDTAVETVTPGLYLNNSGTATDVTLNHDLTTTTPTTSTDSPGYGGTFTAIDSLTINSTGHVTGINTKTVTMPSAENYSWTVAADSGSEIVASGETITWVGGTNVTTSYDAGTNQLTVNSTDQFVGTVTSVSGGDGITITGVSTVTPTVNIDYAGSDNYILVPGTAVADDTDIINFSDTTDSDVKKTTLGTIPVDALTLVKTYIDNSVSGALVYQGGYNPVTDLTSPGNYGLQTPPNPNIIQKGWTYTVTTDGTFFGEQVRVGDVLIAEVDAPTALGDWTTVQNNIDLASLTQVGIGNVNKDTASDKRGLDVTYTSGTAAIGLDIDALPKITTADTDSTIAIFENGAGTNNKIELVDLATIIRDANNKSTSVVIGDGSATSYVLQNTGATTPNKNHGLGTSSDGFMVQCVEVSTGGTVYPLVTRGTGGNVTISFTNAPVLNGIRVLINNVN